MDYKKEFPKCPVCALREELAEILGKPDLKLGDGRSKFCADLAEMSKERGLASKDFRFHFQYLTGIAVEPKEAEKAAVGAEAPSYIIGTDICPDCGCVYASTLTSGDEKKPPPPTQLVTPNRAQRRRMGREGPQPINPFSKS